MAGLKLNHVCKVYDGKVKAVSDVCINIKDKEFVANQGYTRRDIAEFLIKVCIGIEFLHSIRRKC